MKRIVTLDVLRGFSVFMMIVFHVVIHVMDVSDFSFEGLTVPIVIIGILMLFAGHGRAFFLMISSVVHVISMQRSLSKGNSPIRVWLRQLYIGIMIYLVGGIGNVFFDNWGILGYSYKKNYDFIFGLSDQWIWRWDQYNRIAHFEALQCISWCILLVSTIHFFVSLKGGYKKVVRNTMIYLILGCATLTFRPYIHSWVENYWGTPFANAGQYSLNGWREIILKTLMSGLGGLEQPIFPFFATACIGSILGLYLSNTPKEFNIKKPQRIPQWGMVAGLVLILIGTSILLKNPSDINALLTTSEEIHPNWFFLITNGLELIVICFWLRIHEFNKRINSDKMLKYAKRTRLLRRWGIIALSMYILQVWPEYLMRDLFTWMSTINYHPVFRGDNILYTTSIMVVLVVLFWDVLIRLWERVEFKGSFEWLISSIPRLFARIQFKIQRKEKVKSHRETKAIVYEPDYVIFNETRVFS